jgi:bacterioferritin
MKGNKKLLTALNQLLADELTAISQYMVHSEMCKSWGYGKLHDAIEKQAIDEMHHAEWLIERILTLEGLPVVDKLNKMTFGRTAQEIVNVDKDAELDAVRAYNTGIALAREVEDNATADLLTKILKMEEGHVEWAETQRDQIEHMGIQTYLSNQVG